MRLRAVEFSREVFFLEVAEISGRQGRGGVHAREEARRHAARLDEHAALRQLDPACPGAVDLYRRNFLELLRMGKSGSEAYLLSRVIGPVGDAEFGRARENVRRTGYPAGMPAYAAERAAIRLRDPPGGLILLTFFASLFALVWTSNTFRGAAEVGTVFFVALGLAAVGCLMVTSALLVSVLRSTNK